MSKSLLNTPIIQIAFTGKYAAEKLYLPLDKQDYAAGDTKW